jgi:hypothetical protein
MQVRITSRLTLTERFADPSLCVDRKHIKGAQGPFCFSLKMIDLWLVPTGCPHR